VGGRWHTLARAMLPGGALRALRGGVLVASKDKGATSRETGGKAVEEFLRGAARESFWLDQHSLKGGRSARRIKIGHLGTLDPYVCAKVGRALEHFFKGFQTR
jgi:tRNA U55 pseudouridine synthase TruB